MDTLKQVLTRLEANGSALGHFNISDLVMLKAVVASAVEIGAPVMVGASEGERDFMGVGQIAAVVRSLRDKFDTPIFLNADHTHSLEKVVEAAKAGFDEIVIDFSGLPLEQNVARTKDAVEAIKAINPAILAEGEIGDIGTGSEIHESLPSGAGRLTTVEEARQFVHETGIDVLAPAVGNAHGMVQNMVQGKTRKRLDIDRIAEIKKATGSFLTLHGGSGTDDNDFREAIRAGINIIHISTELRVAWRRSLEASLLARPNEVAPYKILRPAVDSVADIVGSRLRLFDGKRALRSDSAAGEVA